MRNSLGLAALAALLVAPPALADGSGDLAAAITAGKAGVNVRARYERVDQDNIGSDADALTARLRLNYGTGKWNGLSLFAEFDHVFHLVSDFNSGGGTSPAKSGFPVVADPKGSDLNQLYVDYGIDEKTHLRVGRQRILLDNQRFVGGVGWRQNEQTYDGLTVTTSAIERTALQYSYIGNVRRIFGERVDAGRNNVDVHLLNARVTLNDKWSVTPYYYRIDNDDVAAFSTATLGARLSGKIRAGRQELALVAEFARQSDIANNPVSYDANYLHLEAGLPLDGGWKLGLGYESLGGDSNDAGKMFRTPLATLHKFQGWADRFLTTPAQGIGDLYASAGYSHGDWTFNGVYHDFSAESGSGDYGSELDLSAGLKLSQNYGVLFKGAFFSGDSAAYPDTNKFWIMFTANY